MQHYHYSKLAAEKLAREPPGMAEFLRASVVVRASAEPGHEASEPPHG